MQENRVKDRETVESLIRGYTGWYHRIELAPGVVTPGVQPSRELLGRLDVLGLPRDCTGLRVLDVGCSDGFFSFEMERRGAEVIGIDYADADATGFSIAARVLGSRVTHKVRNTYNLKAEEDGLFDLVLFLGVLYHLRNPMLALDRVRGVMKPGGLLFVETQLAGSIWLRWLGTPLWQFHPRDSLNRDGSNKWTPNLAGLKSAVAESQFEVLGCSARGARGCLAARAVTDDWLEYHRKLDSSEGRWGKP
jgi:tRNA (mo5U34)-methyltransferase